MAKKRKVAVAVLASELKPKFENGSEFYHEVIAVDLHGKVWWISPQTGRISPARIEDWPKK